MTAPESPRAAPSTPARVAGRGGPVVGVGELLWDLLPGGRALGGAPLNVLVALRGLGREVALVSAVGRDSLGVEARAAARALGVDVAHVQEHPTLPTGTARVVLDAAGSPTFEIVRPAAHDGLELPGRAVRALADRRPVALVVGTLAQQAAGVRAATRRLIEACPGAVVLYDVNIRPGAWDRATVAWLLERASIVKLSAADAQALAGPLDLPWPDGRALLRALARRTRARAVCLTRGAAGAILWVGGGRGEGAGGLGAGESGGLGAGESGGLGAGELVEGRPPEVPVVDTVGAGDAFAAGLLDGLLAGRPPADVLRLALALGALVAARRSATPRWSPAELRAIEERTVCGPLAAG